MEQNRYECSVRCGTCRVKLELNGPDHIEVCCQYRGIPLKIRRWIGRARPGPIQSRTEVHVNSRAGIPLVLTENAISAKRKSVVFGLRQRPYVACSPRILTGQHISEARAIEDACVSALQP